MVFQSRTWFKVHGRPAAFCQLTHFLPTTKRQRLGQRGLQVLLKKLAVPAIAELEEQVLAMALIRRRRGTNIGDLRRK